MKRLRKRISGRHWQVGHDVDEASCPVNLHAIRWAAEVRGKMVARLLHPCSYIHIQLRDVQEYDYMNKQQSFELLGLCD